MVSVEINIDGDVKNYEFPTSWDEVKVSNYQKLYSIKQTDNDNLLYSFEILNALTGIEKDILYLMGIQDFNKLLKTLDFIYNPIESQKLDYLEIEGEKYYLHTDFSKYTAGEIISIDTILKKHNNNYTLCIDELLCIFLRKKVDDRIEKFTTDLFSRKYLYQNLPISQINNIFVFFLTGSDS